MLTQVAIASLNHLLGQATWASERLKPHAGRVAELVVDPVILRLQIESDGRFAEATADSSVDARIELPGVALAHAINGLDAVTRQISVSGNAEFAETLGGVLRKLRWDAEEDLSKVFGDLVARRLVMGFNGFAAWQKSAARSVAESTADYLTEERNVLLRPVEATAYGADVDALRDDLARLEKRVERLEKK